MQGGGGGVREMGKNKQINKPTEQTESKTDSTTQGGKRGRGKVSQVAAESERERERE